MREWKGIDVTQFPPEHRAAVQAMNTMLFELAAHAKKLEDRLKVLEA